MSAPWLVLGFLTPALAQLTLDAGPLNREGPRRVALVLATAGVLCVAYGLVTALAVALPQALAVVRSILERATGLVVVPFAVLLTVVTSAQMIARSEDGRGDREDAAVR